MTEGKLFYAGVDWASKSHHAALTDAAGKKLGEKTFDHSGEGLAAMAVWLLALSGADGPAQVLVAIEVPHGPVVEALLERGFPVHAINPKQMDRFRDRFTLAGAKDDSRDCDVMASALRTDPHCLRRVEAANPTIVELREWSRIAEELGGERNRLTNRLRDQLWRYYPAMLDLDADLSAEWVWELWEIAPTPAKARRLREASVEKLLKRHRIRRLDAKAALQILRAKPIGVAAGTIEAATAHIATLVARLRLANRQIKEAERKLDALIARFADEDAVAQALKAEPSQETEPGQKKQHDAAILASLPGVGRTVLAMLLGEGYDALKRRDYAALRSLTGVAPVTKRSGKTCLVVRRYACHPRLANAVFHWARVAVQHDPRSRAKYRALRERGHSHARALRSIADRQLNVACAMLKTRSLFDRSRAP